MCPRCQNKCLFQTREAFSEDLDTYCVLCGWHQNPPSEFVVQLPLKNYGVCGCGRESLRGTGDCARCRGAKVSEGMMRNRVSVRA